MAKRFVLVFVIFLLICGYFGGNCQDFGYEGEEGPDHWGSKYTKCTGKLQSPIDIESTNAIQKTFPPLLFEHFRKPLDVVLFENNGHTVTMKIIENPKPKLQGGPLKGVYEFVQLHFHWGPNNTVGSENRINHHSFPLELHLVMYNRLYNTFENSLDASDGLTVLSYLFKVNSRDNEKFDKFIDGLREVRSIMANTTLHDFVALDYLISNDHREYFTYEGSLTTPPCSEVVTWIEFVKTIPLSQQQLDEFRTLSTKNGRLTHNFRPIQPTNDRLIYYNGTLPKSSGNVVNIAIALIMVVCYWRNANQNVI